MSLPLSFLKRAAAASLLAAALSPAQAGVALSDGNAP